MELPYEQRFHFHDGSSVGSLEMLAHKLASLSYVEFYRHVNPDKNDFANWVRHVVKEPRLADELDKVSSIVETIEIINDHLHPRPLTQPHADIQSAVERSVFGDKYPGVEDVPSTTPAQAMTTNGDEVADFTIIEETLEGEPVTETGTTVPSASARLATPASAVVTQAQPAGSVSASDHARMIIKDFIFGFLFGLLIGALLGRMLP